MRIVATPPGTVRATSPPADWREMMRTAVRDPAELCRRLRLPEHLVPAAIAAGKQFPLFAPVPYIARMRRGDVHDPLLRQVLPLGDELRSADGFTRDPVGEQSATIAPGLLQKYAGRALIVTTGICAVHCRYCFRRHYPYSDDRPATAERWDAAADRLAADPTIEEAILSGGDPLSLDDPVLERLIRRLAGIDHLQRLRIHTRLPIVIPQRVTATLVQMLRGSRLAPIVVIHSNHANELDDSVAAAISRLADGGIVVLNQAVLLHGVNDDADAQFELCRRLVNLRVVPYYLHQLDRVAGAAHFETPVELGHRIIEQLRARLPGYAVPRFVQEVPGDRGKRFLA